jgi:hypothetical protein
LGLGSPPPTSALGLGSPPPTSAPGLGSPDRSQSCRTCGSRGATTPSRSCRTTAGAVAPKTQHTTTRCTARHRPSRCASAAHRPALPSSQDKAHSHRICAHPSAPAGTERHASSARDRIPNAPTQTLDNNAPAGSSPTCRRTEPARGATHPRGRSHLARGSGTVSGNACYSRVSQGGVAAPATLVSSAYIAESSVNASTATRSAC